MILTPSNSNQIEIPGQMQAAELRVHRQPFHFDCACGHSEILVLPSGEGECKFKCKKCPAVHKLVFNHRSITIMAGVRVG